MKHVIILSMMFLLVFASASCNKTEDKKQLPAGHSPMVTGKTAAMPQDIQKKERAVVVPAAVKAKWTAIKLRIEDRAAKKTTEQILRIGSTLTVPNTNITITAVAFLPDFRMDEKQITTASEKLSNPAAQVLIQEPGKSDWKGWLYSKHPDIHSFPHETISVLLVSGIENKQ
jgi:hypothetical protein